MMETKRHMKQWVNDNVLLSLDQLSRNDATDLLAMAEDKPWTFYQLVEEGLLLSRKLTQQPPPFSKREVVGFMLEFRVKVQMAFDQFEELPAVPLFDFGGDALFKSNAYKVSRLMYGQMGSAV